MRNAVHKAQELRHTDHIGLVNRMQGVTDT
jgi:hypothetical protein